MKYDKKLINTIHASSDLIPKQIYKDKPLTLDNVRQINQKFMGGGMSQNYLAIPWFEYYFDTHNFEYMIEFGSQKGCLSTYFANFAGITEQMFFETYEFNPDKDWSTREYEGCGHWYEKLADLSPYINYFHQDVFSQETQSHIKENVSEFKTFIFADGGDKAREFNMYAPMLKVGDCIAVHDWGQEIYYSQIEHTIREHGLVPDEPFAASAAVFGTWIMPFKKVQK
tara:strand:- start:353 stop:1030 length:678 start_codon:yes stop_codon:yes gene_type:complete